MSETRPKTRRFSTDLVLLVAFAAVLSTLLVASFSWWQAREALDRSLRGQGNVILSVFESTAADHLAAFDDVYLRQYATDIVAKERVLSYAAVANADGTIVAHSDRVREGKKAADPEAGVGDGGAMVSFKGDEVVALSRPVVLAGKKWGTVYVGVNHASVRETLRGLAVKSALAGVLAVLAGGGLAVAFASRNVANFRRVTEKAEQISGGDLTIRVPEEGYEEFRKLAGSFNAMAENLRGMIRQIQEAGGRVGEFSAGITTVIQEQATSASEQAASLAEVTATMEELSRTSHQIAGNAEAVKTTAEQTVDTAQRGTTLVRESVEGMGRVKDRVSDIAQKTMYLGEKSHEIEKVMDLIKEIAGEIHLLALNATIESAAAGEHGRRFAVVASEVRRLAEKTRESTETIRSLVSEIQTGTQGSIFATEQGSREVDRARKTIDRTADAFGEIIEMIEKTSEASMQISLATHQQTSANDQVTAGMRQVADLVRQTASSMKVSSASTAELKGMAGTLAEKTAVFKV